MIKTKCRFCEGFAISCPPPKRKLCNIFFVKHCILWMSQSVWESCSRGSCWTNVFYLHHHLTIDVCLHFLLTAVCLVAALLAVRLSVAKKHVVRAGVFGWHRRLGIYVVIIVAVVIVRIVLGRRQAGAIPNCQWGRVGSVRLRTAISNPLDVCQCNQKRNLMNTWDCFQFICTFPVIEFIEKLSSNMKK